MAIVVCPNPDCRMRFKGPDRPLGEKVACPSCGAAIGSTASSLPSPVSTPASGGLLSPRAIRFSCPNCGKLYRAGAEDFGKTMACKKCHSKVAIPDAAAPPSAEKPTLPTRSAAAATAKEEDSFAPPPPSESRTEADAKPAIWRDPIKLGLCAAAAAAVCGVLFLLLAAIAAIRGSLSLFLVCALAAALVLAVVAARLAIQAFAAKQRALGGRPVRLLFGLARLVTWEQNEGLIFLRDKRISEQIYGPKSGGGFRIIYPFLGEELRDRVPLTLQLTWFRDEKVLTREAIQLSVKVAFWWQVCDLEKYFYKIDRQVHAIDDKDSPSAGVATAARPTPRGRLGIAEIWLLALAESCLRTLISGTSTFLIISKRAASCLHVEERGDVADGSGDANDLAPATPDAIAEKVKAMLQPKVRDYGLELDRVEVQEVQLPAQIQEAVDVVWSASTLPAKSRYEAEAQRNRLQALCDLLGREGAIASEVVKELPEGAFLGNPLAPLQTILASLGTLAGGSAPASTAALVPESAAKEPALPGAS
jgi:regulator of protease activity HflC (stomatin/prohibitin superfamily)/predicted RNA-binding Zn-ribbon protein involved in translation (DUF1610 family)